MAEQTTSRTARIAAQRSTGRKKRVLLAVAVAAAAGLGIQLLTGGAPAARDGELELSAESVVCGLTAVGPAESSRKPSGQYCTVKVTVRNHGAKAVKLHDYEQVAVDQGGKEYRPDLVAGQVAESAEQHLRFLSPIEPGASVAGVLVYDLPAGATLKHIMVRASAGSTGSQLSLS